LDIVYILSPARSGSTFLQLLLGGHPNIVGIGEVKHVLKEYCQTQSPKNPAHGDQCSCGQEPRKCPFWGPILDDLSGASMETAVKLILEHFSRLFPDKMLIDSSKSGEFLENYYLKKLCLDDDLQIQLKILYLVRDFRG